MKLINSLNIIKVPVILASALLLSACQNNTVSNTIQDPSKEEWQSLFNGNDLTGWDLKMAGFALNENHLDTFVVEDGMLRVKYDNYKHFNSDYGHLYYKTPFSYYKLKFDYRFTGEQMNGGSKSNVRNSGIMLHSQSAASNEHTQPFPVSVEFQMLGGLSDGKPRTTGNVCTPGTALEINGKVDHNHCISSTSKTYFGDQWVHGEAIVMGGESMTFNIEGETVLTFQKPQLNGDFVNKRRKGRSWGKLGISRDKQMWLDKSGDILTEGYIALQAESHAIDFKNIELLNLVGCMDSTAKNYKDYFIKANNNVCIY